MTVYHGIANEKNDNYSSGKIKYFLIFGVLLLLVISCAFLIYRNFSPTGNAVLEIKNEYSQNENLSGKINLLLSEDELIPVDSDLTLTLESYSRTYKLGDVVDTQITRGNYYARGTSISGSGEGFGSLTTHPEISFELKIINSDQDTNSNEPEPEQPAELSPNEETNEDQGSLLTGNAVANLADNEEIISGSVSKGNNFVYEGEFEDFELVEGSVSIAGEPLDESVLSISFEDGGIIIVSTDYEITEENSDGETSLSIDLSTLNIPAREGSFEVSLSYQGEDIVSASQDIQVNSEDGQGEVTAEEENMTSNESEVVKSVFNITFLRQIRIFDTERMAKNDSVSFDLADYFTSADSFEFVSSGIDASFDGSIAVLTPKEGFAGASKAQFIALNGSEKFEGNEFTVLVSSGAVNIVTSRERIVVGQPVKWKKNITLEEGEALTVDIPTSAENISIVKSTETGEEEIETSSVLTGNVIRSDSSTNGILSFFKNLISSITGNVIAEEPTENSTLQIELNQNATNYIVEYQTPAPEYQEENTSSGKNVVISASDELGYTNVIAFSNIEEKYPVESAHSIRIYWRNYDLSSNEIKSVDEVAESEITEEIAFDIDNNDSDSAGLNLISEDYILQQVPFDAYDLDFDGLIDYVEWVVPHLSNQTFEIIYITKAEHLDSNKTFIRDIYDYVSVKDDNYTSIPSGDYIRVTFEKNLTSNNDITLYAKSNAPAIVEVYEKDNNNVLLSFNITNYSEYKKYLSNLPASQDTFDILVKDAEVEFDYIVDPSTPGNINSCQTLDMQGLYNLTQNITITSNLCFNVTANNVTIDGNGYDLIGNFSIMAINVQNVYNFSLRNISLLALDTGIRLLNVSDAQINDTVARTVYNGMIINNSRRIYLNRDKVNNTGLSSPETPGSIYGEISYCGYCDFYEYRNNGYGHDIRIYPYKLIDGTPYFSENYLSYNDYAGEYLYDDGGGDNNDYYIYWYWDPVPSVDGYRIIKYDEATPRNYDYYYDTPYNELYDGDGSFSWTAGSTVTPALKSSGSVTGFTLFNLNSSNFSVVASISSSTRDLDANGVNDDNFIVDSVISKYNIASLSKLYFRNSTYGEIKFLSGVNGTGNTLLGGSSSDIVFGNDSVYVNSAQTGLNKSANITLYGIGERGYVSPTIFKDAGACTNCYNFTSLNATNVIFNVSSWSTYSIGDPDPVSPQITFVNPTPLNNTYQNINSIYVNITSNDTNGHFTFVDFDSSLVSWIKLDQGNGTFFIDEMSRNNGTCATGSCPNFDPSNYWNGSYAFTSDSITVPDSNNLDLINNFTISLWAKAGSSLTEVFAVSKKATAYNQANGFEFYHQSAANNLDFVGQGGGVERVDIVIDGGWHHYSITMNNGNVTIYYDGVPQNPSTNYVGGSLSAGTDNLILGRRIPYGYYDGNMDELLIFNRSLSQQEVKALYNAGTNKYYNNFTNVTLGDHRFIGYAMDRTGNRNQTELRIVNYNTTNVGTCTNLNLVNTIYLLKSNLTTTESCLNITADNITLSGNGNTIDGDDSGTDYGIFVNARINVTIKNIANISDFDSGIYFSGTNQSLITNVTTYSNNYGLYLSSSKNNNFTRLNLSNSVSSDLYQILSAANDSYFIDSISIGSYNLGTISKINFINSTYGEIKFSLGINGIGSNFFGTTSSDIRIGNNSAYVNSAQTGINRSANITLYSLPTNFVHPVILKDGNLCTTCYNFTNLTAGTVVFNVTAWSNYSVSEDPTIITACGDLPTAGRTYKLQNNITDYAGTCFTISADNITLDLNGYTVDGTNDATTAYYGVYVQGRNNITIKNGTVKEFGDYGCAEVCDGAPIYLINSNNSFVKSVNLFGGFVGLYLLSSGFNTLTDIVSNLSYVGIYINFFSSSNTLVNITANENVYGLALESSSSSNTLVNITANANLDTGIYLVTSSNANNFTNITTNANVNGILSSGSNSNSFVGTTANANLDTGIYVSVSNSTTFTNITANANVFGVRIDFSSSNRFTFGSINASIQSAVHITGISSSNNTFASVNITNTNAGYYDLFFNTASINGTQFIDMPHIGNYSFTGVGGTIAVSKTGIGEIKFLNMVNGSGKNFTSDIQIGSNLAYVNSTQSGLNRSANITLYGLSTGFIAPAILKDGALCTNCYNFTSLNAGTVVFNVSSWSNYSIGESSSLTACANLSTPNIIYNLQSNILNYNGTCFNISANNVTFNGNGYVLDGDDSGTDYGIVSAGTYNATIRNFPNITGFYGGIYITSSNASILTNLTAIYNSGIGISLDSNSSILTNITSSSNSQSGISLPASSNVLNSIVVNSNSQYGLIISSSNYNNVSYLTSNLNGQYGIYVATGNSNSFYNLTSNSNGFYGVYISNGNSNSFYNLTSNSNALGIRLDFTSSNRFTLGTINASIQNAIVMAGVSSFNNSFTNISITNTNASFRDLLFNTASINGTQFIDMPHIGNYSFTGVGGTVIIAKTSFGEIRFINPINGSGTNLSSDIQIVNNSALINASQSGLNRAANITLNGIGNRGYTRPVILKDGSVCLNCYNFTNLNASTVVFNVSSGGNYSIGNYTDLVAPKISFVSPTPLNSSSNHAHSIYVNVSSNDSEGDHYILTDFDKSLVSWFRFEKGNGTFFADEMSRNNATCATGNCPNFDSSGYWNGSYNFSNSYVLIPDSDSLDFSINFTISFWAKANPSASTVFAISKKVSDIGQTEGFEFYYESAANNLDFIGVDGNYQRVTRSIDSDWHNYVLVMDANAEVFIYVDGSLQTPDTAYEGGGLYPGTDDLYIGYRPWLDSYYDGKMDELVILNRSLSSQEINALYNASANQYFNNFTSLEYGNHTVQAYAVDKYGNKNQTELRTINLTNGAPSTPTLLYPTNYNVNYTRNLTFFWSASDGDGDTLQYELNISCFNAVGTTCSSKGNDGRYYNLSIVSTSPNYTLPVNLKYFIDDGYHYNWTVRAYDGTVYSSWSQSFQLNLSTLISVSMPIASVDFGDIDFLTTYNTSTNSPSPFVIQNDGNVKINISVNASDLWQTATNPTQYYQFKADNNSVSSPNENLSFSWLQSITTYTNMSNITTWLLAISQLNYIDNNDSAEVDIKIKSPPSEGYGRRNSTITFYATMGE